MPDFALLIRELERCGWKRGRGGPLAGELLFQTAQGGVHTPALLLQSDAGESILLIEFGDFALGGRDELFPRFLDFSMEVRLALGAASLVASADRLLLRTAGEIDLFRLPEEVQEYRAASQREFEEELLPALASKPRQRGESLRSFAPSVEGSQALRGWLSHWSQRLAAQLEVPPDDCEKFLWKIILMLQVTRKAGKSEMLGGWGLGCEKLGDRWTLSYDSLETHADLARLLDDFDQTFSTRIFTGDAETHKEWLARIEETSLAEQLRAELLMQSQAKFEAENVAWLYTQMEREQEGWRREVAGLAPIRKRLATEGWSVLEPLDCHVGGYGLSFALREFERLAAFWNDYSTLARAHDPKSAGGAFTQLDLFQGAPRGVSKLGQLDDPLNFLFSESIRLSGVPAEDEFGVGLVFLLKALSFARRFDWPFFGIDTLDCLWKASANRLA